MLTETGELDVDALHRLLEAADSVIEGQPYAEKSGNRFFGTVVLTVPTPAVHAERLASALLSDPRAAAATRDRVARELARLLGPDTPTDFEMSARTEVAEGSVRVDIDVEAPLPALDHTS